ncbi:MAG TPA: hypothetical protein VLC55_05010 [Burkholderiales bacterium]|nr:hypothetical protein [Burkholderiales bacterium]
METNPEIVIIDTELPTRDLVEQVCVVTQNAPRPGVVFTADGEGENAGIQAALQGGRHAVRLRPAGDPAPAAGGNGRGVIAQRRMRPASAL